MIKKIIAVLILILAGGLFVASIANGENSESESIKQTYYDKDRDTVISVVFDKKNARLSGKNFGNDLKLIAFPNNQVTTYKKDSLLLKKENDKVFVFIKEKEVFEGELQKDKYYKKSKQTLIAENVWQWENANSFEDNFLKPTNYFELSFTKEGKVIAKSAVCGIFNGSYRLAEDKLEVILEKTGGIACESKEDKIFINSLKNINSVSFDRENNLILFLKENIGTLKFIKK